MENGEKIYKAINKALGLSSPESLANNAILLREVNAFREQAYKAWDFLSSLVEYNARIIPNSTDVPDIWGDEVQVKHALMAYMERGIPDNMAILHVEGKELPISPRGFELRWLRVCEAMVLSDELDTWHYKVIEAYRRVAGDPIPTAIQAQEAEERLAGLSTLSEVCRSFERVATFGDSLPLNAIRALYEGEVERIRAKHKPREDEELYREAASELLASQCTAGATLEQATAPEVAGLQAKIKELEQALEASEAEREKLAEVLNEFAENEASGPSDVIKRVLMAKGVQGVYRLCRVLDKAKERGVITEVAGKLQWGSNTIVTNAQCAYMVARLNAEFYPKGNIRWSDWCRVIGGITAKSLSNSYHPRKTHAINIEGKGDIDELFDD